MLTLLSVLYICILVIYAQEPCEKLKEIGDNVQNKAILSPVIIQGKPGLKIDLPSAQYKLTIDIAKIIKGSLGQWKKNLIIAGQFSTFKDKKNVCRFQSDFKKEQLFFLEVISEIKGEYRVLFNPEIISETKLEIINKSICEKCGSPPTVTITDLSKKNDIYTAECVGTGFPIPVVNWILSGNSTKTKLQPIKNGVKLIQPVNNSTNGLYTCKASNVFGDAMTKVVLKSLLFKAPNLINRCSPNDNRFCNGHGKCYEDKSEKDMKFCRCDPGFEGPKCNNSFQTRKVPMAMVERLSKKDDQFCNFNGKAYRNVKSNSTVCICENEFLGPNCKNKMIGRAAIRDDSELRTFIVEQTSKMASKYILIGCMIVLGGCVVVCVLILCLWKFYLSKIFKRKYDEDKTTFGSTNQTMKDTINHAATMKSKDENDFLLTNIEPSKIPNSVKPTYGFDYSIDFSTNKPKPFSNAGIYEGVNIPAYHQ